jgi:hypothetical protein
MYWSIALAICEVEYQHEELYQQINQSINQSIHYCWCCQANQPNKVLDAHQGIDKLRLATDIKEIACVECVMQGLG